MKNLTVLLLIGMCINCGITIIYDENGHPDYEAINEQYGK